MIVKPVTLPPEMVAVAAAVSPTNELLSLPSFVMSNAVPEFAFEMRCHL